MKLGKITSAMALAMAVATVPAMALNTHASRTRRGNATQVNRQGQFQQMFTRMDRNGDGVITRNEWNRDPAMFDRLDLNRDGLITQAEAQQVFSNYQQYNANSGNRFRGMDRNGDGVITRDEWRGNDRSFEVHDTNHDGVLSGNELRGNGQGYGRGDENDDNGYGQQQRGNGKGHMKQGNGRGHGDDQDNDRD